MKKLIWGAAALLAFVSFINADSFSGGGGSGSNKTSATAVGSEPSTPAIGDLDFYTNSPMVVRWNGSAWVPWGGVFFPLTTWVDSGFSWVNQGTSSVSLANNILFFTGQTGGSGSNSIRARVQSTPGPPYTITVMILTGSLFAQSTSQGQEAGLLVRDSSALTLATCSLQQTGSPATDTIAAGHWTNPTTFSASVASQNIGTLAYIWLRFKDDSTNRTCSFSVDGVNFNQVSSETRTTFVTPNQYGYYVNGSNNLPILASFISILQN